MNYDFKLDYKIKTTICIKILYLPVYNSNAKVPYVQLVECQ